MIAEKKSGPTFCHWCYKRLQGVKGGLFYKELWLPKDDLAVRVHGDCVKPALAEGYRRPPEK